MQGWPVYVTRMWYTKGCQKTQLVVIGNPGSRDGRRVDLQELLSRPLAREAGGLSTVGVIALRFYGHVPL